MSYNFFEFFLIIILTSIQSIAGVGVLVIGTPVLLLINFSIVETMNYLLPISIITSFLNLIIMKFKKEDFFYDYSRLKLFFLICIPFVFFGLLILRKFNNVINFDLIVAFIIISTLVFKEQITKILKKLSSKVNKLILMIIGIVHGITNSGGTLLSIFSINLNSSKKKSRSEITLFYFFLALFQFILFYYLFGIEKNTYEYHNLFIQIILGVTLGNFLIKFISKIFFDQIVYLLALITCLSLIFKNII